MRYGYWQTVGSFWCLGMATTALWLAFGEGSEHARVGITVGYASGFFAGTALVGAGLSMLIRLMLQWAPARLEQWVVHTLFILFTSILEGSEWEFGPRVVVGAMLISAVWIAVICPAVAWLTTQYTGPSSRPALEPTSPPSRGGAPGAAGRSRGASPPAPGRTPSP